MSNDAPVMTSHRPYLLRALYEWIADNGMTPHLLVDATQPGVRVPAHTVKEGRVVLNVADRAVSRLEMDNDAVRFTARFGGVSQPVLVPIAAILAIYARETGQGMALPEDVAGTPPPDDADASGLGASDQGDATDEDPDGRPPSDGGTPPPRRGHLRVVK
ncbi:ClpXP protease specificity-enhancing factor [Luteimonas sp. MC1825]|nr:ClpXP protease specificity-enhancing factor [Luteimonas sp. MC1825]QOC88838.1 ClpXP protease specificity-enhancing factor [Luteimonas sp. MC1825]